MKKIYFIIASAVLAVSCSEKHAEVHDEKFCLSDTMSRVISIDTVKKQRLANELTLSGKVTANEDKVVKVFPLVGGIIEDLRVELGDYVEKGQTLAIVKSSEIADFEKQLISAESNLSIAQKNFSVTQDMYKAGLASEKEMVMDKKELQKAESELKRIREVFRIYGIQGNSLYTMKAPISGFIIEKNVTENMQYRTENANNFFTISGLEEIWVIANVYETDINKIKVGYDAEIKVLPYPDKVFRGKIDKIFNVLDPATRVMKVRVRMTNKGFELKPEMYAQVIVRYEEGDNSMLAVPSESIVFDKNRNFVMVYTDKCSIETREVEIQQRLNTITYIKSGLKEGERIISNHQLLVYNALNN
ncbi:efflux RND transporter periplasmic adaptor subunit [Sporocytophaga myxococcoides]|uniref:efflux RND transporter periplasmic adaptor subunit n=1 Tax=Sporocytophaga myxococcoides TaxID=153721 RepID=UPI00041C10AB|nr:efflux RND transporter periplasmic adaptor subunit [Sporocytophaga myxococcoides]